MNKILIIDDEEKIRTLLSRIISLEGFEVFQASDLKNAKKRLEVSDIDVIICDVNFRTEVVSNFQKSSRTNTHRLKSSYLQPTETSRIVCRQ